MNIDIDKLSRNKQEQLKLKMNKVLFREEEALKIADLRKGNKAVDEYEEMPMYNALPW